MSGDACVDECVMLSSYKHCPIHANRERVRGERGERKTHTDTHTETHTHTHSLSLSLSLSHTHTHTHGTRTHEHACAHTSVIITAADQGLDFRV